MKIIAHRGASGYEPENTIASFERALELDVDMIELDVYTIKSGELVVIHDKTVDRTTDGHGPIESFTYEKLKLLDAGNGERIPLLRTVIELVARRIPINIELKGLHTAQPTAELIRDFIKRGWRPHHFIVSSFNHNELDTFVKLAPMIQTSALFGTSVVTPGSIARMKGVYSANFDYRYLTPQNIEQVHKIGAKVYAYTVNSKEDAQKLNAMHVDGIFSNYPDKVAA